MKITTIDIIKVLPFEDQYKNDLLTKFDSMAPVQKGAIEQLLWDALSAMYRLKFEQNMQLAFAKAADGKEKLDKDLHKRVKEQTEREMEHEFFEKSSVKELSMVRNKLQQLIDKPLAD